MVALGSLWLPILLSAVLVFFAGFALHTLVDWHWNDYAALPDEPGFMEAVRRFAIGRGQYHFPKPGSRAEFADPAFVEKAKAGPVGILYVLEPMAGPGGRRLAQHFAYCLVIGLFAAYLAGATLQAGAPYLAVFRVVGTAAFLGYAGAVPLNAIWFGWSWSATWKTVADGLLYALLTAGTFGWLWP